MDIMLFVSFFIVAAGKAKVNLFEAAKAMYGAIKEGGLKLEKSITTYQLEYGKSKLIAVKEMSSSIGDLPDADGKILRWAWKEAGFARPLSEINAAGKNWVFYTASQGDLKDGGAVYVEAEFYKKNEAVLGRPATSEIILLKKEGKKLGYTQKQIEKLYVKALDELTVSEYEYSIANAEYAETIGKCNTLTLRKENEAKIEYLREKKEVAFIILEEKKKALAEVKKLGYRKSIKSKWTTQKSLQTRALALTPSAALVEINNENTIVLPAHTRIDNVGKQNVRKLSAKAGHMSAEKVSEVKFSGPDGMFIISKIFLQKCVKEGKITKKLYKQLIKEGCIQARGDNPDNDGWFALKGLGVIADGQRGEAIVVDAWGNVRLYKPGMNILTADTVKDWFLYSSADEFFAQRRRIRFMSHNWERGNIKTGRQLMQPLTQATMAQIKNLIKEDIKALKASEHPQGYKESVEKRIRAMVPDLTDEQYELIQSLWMHPAMTMQQVKTVWCKLNEVLAAKVHIHGASAPVGANVKWFFDVLVYGMQTKTSGDLKRGEIKVPKGWAPIGAIGVAYRYPYTVPLYYLVKVVGYTDGNYFEVSMQEGELIMPHLSMDFDGDHMGVIFDPDFVAAAIASNIVAEMLGATYLVYDDNKGEDWIACCHDIEYVEAAPELGSAGIATAPLFLLYSLIPNAKLYEKYYNKPLTRESKVRINGQLILLDYDERGHITRYFIDESDPQAEQAVTIGEVMDWIQFISADVTWQVDAVKRAAKSPYAETEEGKRMKAFCKNLFAASQWHDHPFGEKEKAMLEQRGENQMIALDNVAIIDRVSIAAKKQLGWHDANLNIEEDVETYPLVREGVEGSIELVMDPSLHEATKWHPIPRRATMYSTGDEQMNKFIGYFDPTLKLYEGKIYCGEKLGYLTREEIEDRVFCGFETRTKEFVGSDDERYDRINIDPTREEDGIEVIDIGVYVTRLLRVMLRWNHRNSDPRMKKDVTESAYDVGRMLCHIAYFVKFGEKLTDKQADIMLYRMFAFYLFGAKPRDTVGDELVHVLNYYTAYELNGEKNEHAYLRMQLDVFRKEYVDENGVPHFYNDEAKNDLYIKWSSRKRVVITKAEHEAEQLAKAAK